MHRLTVLQRVVTVALQNRWMAGAAFLGIIALGVVSLKTLPVDAFPDTTPVQVQVNTVAPELSPEEIERQISFPIETAISGLPGLINVRSVSKFGFSQVVVTFDDGTSILDGRQLIMERLGTVQLPAGIEPPSLGPIATGLGEIFHYLVRSRSGHTSLEELRTLHDWIVKPELRKVSGVAEVNSWGGDERQHQVVVEPTALLSYKLTLRDVVRALEENNRNVGGGRVRVSGEGLLLHGVGRLQGTEDIENVVIATYDGVPVKIADVATVQVGREIRRGAVTAQGRGEVVLGLAFMLMGENSKEVSQDLTEQLAGVQSALPDDVELVVVHNRTELVDKVISTVKHNLLWGAALVVVVLFFLFGSFRGGLIVAATIPLAMVMAAAGMRGLAITASLLSLGALDFGVIVDGSVVMAENNLRRLAEKQKELGRALTRVERFKVTLISSQEVARPVFFGVLIIMLVLVPVLTLEGTEGKMFRPMALTFMLALLAGLIVALVLTPALSLWFLPSKASMRDNLAVRWVVKIYEPLLGWTLRFRRAAIGGALALLVLGGVLSTRIGSEFVPKLSEGSVVLNVVRLAGISVEESVAYNTRMEALLLEAFPEEIEHIWSRIGTAEVATDPMGTELTDIFLTLTPRDAWTRAETRDALVQQMEALLSDLPGQTIAYTQPIEMRINEMTAGIRADLGIKIYGDDFDELTRISNDIQVLLTQVEGAQDVAGEQVTGQPVLRVTVDQAAIARTGVPADRVLEVVSAVGGIPAGEIQEGQRRFPLVVRLPDEMRRYPESLASMLIPTQEGPIIPLASVAPLEVQEGPSTITREWGRRRTLAQCNIRGRDIGSFVEEVRTRIDNEIVMPPGYTLEYGGQFEQLERANARFMILVPATLALVFLLLLLSLRRLGDTLIVFTGIPLAAVGGVLALWMRGLPFSVSAAVGFIALSGIAVLNGQVLVSTVRKQLSEGKSMVDAVRAAGRRRVRPVLATAITDAAGFLPMAISVGVGAEVQRPLATVVIGGVLTSTALTLLVLPLLFTVFQKWLGSSQEARNPVREGVA